jgi:hypothetical protein
VGEDHGGGNVCMAQKLLNGTDIVAFLQKMGREGMTQGMISGPLLDAGLLDGFFDDLLKIVFVQVMAPSLSDPPLPSRTVIWSLSKSISLKRQNSVGFRDRDIIPGTWGPGFGQRHRCVDPSRQFLLSAGL